MLNKISQRYWTKKLKVYNILYIKHLLNDYCNLYIAKDGIIFHSHTFYTILYYTTQFLITVLYEKNCVPPHDTLPAMISMYILYIPFDLTVSFTIYLIRSFLILYITRYNNN